MWTAVLLLVPLVLIAYAILKDAFHQRVWRRHRMAMESYEDAELPFRFGQIEHGRGGIEIGALSVTFAWRDNFLGWTRKEIFFDQIELITVKKVLRKRSHSSDHFVWTIFLSGTEGERFRISEHDFGCLEVAMRVLARQALVPLEDTGSVSWESEYGLLSVRSSP